MDSDAFDALFAKSMTGELSATEQADLRRLASGESTSQHLFQDLTGFHNLLRESAPLLRGLRITSRPVPAAVLDRLRRGVKRKSAILATALHWIDQRLSKFSKPTAASEHSAKLAEKLLYIQQILSVPVWARQLAEPVRFRKGETIPIYSPVGNTIYATPAIFWRTEAGKSYDLTLRELRDPGRTLKASRVFSPLPFDSLVGAPDGPLRIGVHYRLTVAESSPSTAVSEVTFYVMKVPQSSKEVPSLATRQSDQQQRADNTLGKIAAALEALSESPARYSDALADLLTLPRDVQEDEAVLRLKAFVFGSMGLLEEHEIALSKLKKRYV